MWTVLVGGPSFDLFRTLHFTENLVSRCASARAQLLDIFQFLDIPSSLFRMSGRSWITGVVQFGPLPFRFTSLWTF
jgi:hypothetical protein